VILTNRALATDRAGRAGADLWSAQWQDASHWPGCSREDVARRARPPGCGPGRELSIPLVPAARLVPVHERLQVPPRYAMRAPGGCGPARGAGVPGILQSRDFAGSLGELRTVRFLAAQRCRLADGSGWLTLKEGHFGRSAQLKSLAAWRSDLRQPCQQDVQVSVFELLAARAVLGSYPQRPRLSHKNDH
jgi:hypothetical protein